LQQILLDIGAQKFVVVVIVEADADVRFQRNRELEFAAFDTGGSGG